MGLKFQNRLKSEKSEITNDVNNIIMMPPASSGLRQKQSVKNKSIQKEELVKYMSKLPSYLEREGKHQDKALNIGVLDWRSLQQWQYNHPQMHSGSTSGYSPSTSNTSSSKDGPSNCNNSRHHSCCPPAGQKAYRRRPSLQSYLDMSPVEGPFECVESSGNSSKFQHINGVPKNPLNVPRESHQFFNKKSSEKIKQSISKGRGSGDFENASKGKLKLKVQEIKESVKSQNLHNNICQDTDKNVELLLPKYGPDGTETNGRESSDTSRMSSLSDEFDVEDVFGSELCSNIPHSCPLPPRDIDPPSSPIKPFKNKIMGDKLTKMPINSSANKFVKESDATKGTTKVRNPLQFSIASGRIGRNSNSNEGAAVPQISSADVTAKSDTERLEASRSLKNSTIQRSNAMSRLLKPKVGKDAASTDVAFDGRGEVLTSLRTTNLDDSHHNEKEGSSTLQAYLQIAVKNDLPLFTFAVDNNSDVLAATTRKSSFSRKDDSTWIYTFFTILEVKKKSGGWFNQGSSKGKEYIPNVVAQMKVSDLPFTHSERHNSVDQFSIKEFVLFAVDLKLLDQQTSDLQPNDELAAIVVKFPRKIQEEKTSDNNITDLSDFGLKEESYPDIRDSSTSKNIQGNWLSNGSNDIFSTTVILPGGVHGFPSKGEPSPLVERWRSGGLCDCGGWDLGCRVKVLANQNRSKNCSLLELFSQSQEESQRHKPLFTLASLKNGTFSVEFDSSISLVQAFAICVAVFDSRKPSEELQQWSNLFEEKLAQETILSLDNYRIKIPNQIRVDSPARYASHPPHSPVGRV